MSCTDDVAGACACVETFGPPSSRYRWTGKYSVRGPSYGDAYQCTGRNVMRWRMTFEGNAFVLTAVKMES